MCRPIVYLFWVIPNNTYIVQFTLFKIKRVVVKMALLKTNLLKQKTQTRMRETAPDSTLTLHHCPLKPFGIGFKIHFPTSATCCRTRGIGRAGPVAVDAVLTHCRTLSSFSLADKLCLVWSFCFPTTDKLSTWLDPYDFCHIELTVVSIRPLQPWCLFAMQS